MRKPSLGARRSIEFNVTPMIDVVFLLIIFFLVSSHLASQETPVLVDLPSATSRDDDSRGDPADLTINILSDGQLLWGTQSTAVDDLGPRLAATRERAGGALRVRIRADRSASYGHVEPLLRACAEADVWSVSFSVVEEESSGPTP